jgi:FAD/FMN-containing dehydrogenase
MNARTGTLSINTVHGAGEVRLVGGEVVDAVFRRMEGEKALYRLFGEEEGSFAFATSAASPHRRIQVSTHALLMEGMRQVDELRRRMHQIADGEDALLSIAPASHGADEVSQRVSEALSVPHTLEELLEDLPFSDLKLLDALGTLIELGSVRKVPRGAVQVELAQRERFAVLSALVKKLQRAGFSGPARLAVLAPPRRITSLMHSVRRIVDATVPTESVPAAPVPYLLATLRLAEGVELEVMGIPALEAFQPLWSLSLPGSALVVCMDYAAPAAVREFCGVLGIPFLDAAALLGDLDEADPAQVAALISGALEAATGG